MPHQSHFNILGFTWHSTPIRRPSFFISNCITCSLWTTMTYQLCVEVWCCAVIGVYNSLFWADNEGIFCTLSYHYKVWLFTKSYSLGLFTATKNMNGEFTNDWYGGIIMVEIKIARSIWKFRNRSLHESWFANMDHKKYWEIVDMARFVRRESIL